METVTVYRLEDVYGEGVFQAGRSQLHDYYARRRCRHAAFDLPSVPDDCFGFKEGLHICAFRSLTQLRRWFRSRPGCRALAGAGIRLRSYRVPREDVVFGREQVAFDPYFAELVEDRCPSTIH